MYIRARASQDGAARARLGHSGFPEGLAGLAAKLLGGPSTCVSLLFIYGCVLSSLFLPFCLCVCSYMCIYIYIYIHTYIMCIYIYIHTYIYIYISCTA